MIAELSPRARLFTFERPVLLGEPSFEASIGCSADTAGLMANINRIEPHIVSAPAVQGKRTLLYGIRTLMAGSEWERFRDRWLDLAAEDFLSRETVVASVAVALGGDPRSANFRELLESASVLRENASQNLTTLLLVETSRCANRDVLSWLVHSIFQMGSDLRDLGEALGVRVLMTGNRDLSALTVGPSSVYPFPQIVLRNLTFVETRQLIGRVSDAAETLGGMYFAPGAIKRIFQATNGDKYFVNYLAAYSVATAEEISKRKRLVVTVRCVDRVVDMFRRGYLRESRVLPRIWTLWKRRPDAIESLVDRELMPESASRWDSMQRDVRELLFEGGLVGPVIEEKPSSISDKVEYSSNSRYDIRNPMIEHFIRETVLNEARSSFVFFHGEKNIATQRERQIEMLYAELTELERRRHRSIGAAKEFKVKFELLRRLQEEESEQMDDKFAQSVTVPLTEQKYILSKMRTFKEQYENTSSDNSSSDNSDQA